MSPNNAGKKSLAGTGPYNGEWTSAPSLNRLSIAAGLSAAERAQVGLGKFPRVHPLSYRH